MDPVLKGMALGVSNAIAIALLMAASVATGTSVVTEYSLIGGELWNSQGGKAPPEVVLWVLLILGTPSGMLWGMLIGSMTHDDHWPPWLRAGAYVTCANLAMLVSSRLWPELLPEAFIPTTIHALLLARWNRPPDPLPARAFALFGDWRDRFRRGRRGRRAISLPCQRS